MSQVTANILIGHLYYDSFIKEDKCHIVHISCFRQPSILTACFQKVSKYKLVYTVLALKTHKFTSINQSPFVKPLIHDRRKLHNLGGVAGVSGTISQTANINHAMLDLPMFAIP